jgi:glutamate/tyrosine decarboxylase-like PLP-dependent enzyme
MSESVLFPSTKTRLMIDHALTDLLAASRDRVNAGSVVPSFDAATFRDQLRRFDFENPLPIDQTLAWTVAQMETGLVHVAHPRYFGLFNPTPTFPAQCADRIAATFNPQLATSTTSPAAVEIEAHVIQAIARRTGLPPEAGGHFTTGGAEANYTALLLALTRACPDFGSKGTRAFRGQPTFYVSRDSHLAWIKIAHQAGIGRSAVRLIATDGAGAMDARALSAAIQEDRKSGHEPVMVVATAGTTNAGIIDPLHACADLTDQTGIWFHVDAAWGGALVASDKYRLMLSGIERADSITIDAHKWFAVTMGCGMFITRWRSLLFDAFYVATGYMPSGNHDDPYTNSMQWSRRFLGLRLFLSLAVAGWSGYAEHVERTIALANELARKVAMLGDWRVLNGHTGVICLEPPSHYRQDVRTIVKRVVASGKVWASVAEFEGRDVIRSCLTSGETTRDDVTELVHCLVSCCDH